MEILPRLEKPTPAYEEIRDRMTEQEQEVIKLLGKEYKGQFTDYQETEDERLCLEQLTSCRRKRIPKGKNSEMFFPFDKLRYNV